MLNKRRLLKNRQQLYGNNNAGGSSDIAWEFDASTGSVRPSRGIGTATFTRATTAVLTDWEGVVRDVLSGEVRLSGMRRVRNLLSRSQEFDNASWTKVRSTISADSIIAPDGSTTADKLQEQTDSATNRSISQTLSFVSGSTYSFSVYAKAAERTEINLRFGGAAFAAGNVSFTLSGAGSIVSSGTIVGPAITALADGWYRCEFRSTATSSASDGAQIFPRSGGTITYDGVAGSGLYIWGAQVEDVTTQATQTASEYVSTNVQPAPYYHGAMVDGVKYFSTNRSGVSLTTYGYLSEPASTNLVLQSENFGTTWAAVGATSPTRSAAAARCGRVVLDLLGDDSALAAEGYTQTVTFTGNAVKSISFVIKQGTSTSSVVRLRDNTGLADRLLLAITWSGGVPTVTMTTGTLEGTSSMANGCYRVRVQTTSVTAANTNTLEVYPATTAAFAIGNTGDIYVGGVMAEDDAAQCSTYIPTTTATVTRNADSLTYTSITGASQATLAGFVEANLGVLPPAAGGNYTAMQWDDGTSNNRHLFGRVNAGGNTARGITLNGGASQADIAPAATLTAGVTFKAIYTAAANDAQAATNGTLGAQDTSVTMPTGLATLRLGRENGGGHFRGGRIKKARLYNVRPSDASLQQATA